MRRHVHSVRDFLVPVIDFFYPPFRRIMDMQTFRYAACGGGNTLLGLVIFYVSFKYILRGENLDLRFYVFKAYNVALFISFIVNFCVGFFLLKFVVFVDSNIKGRVQLFRYFSNFVLCLFINYFLLKLFVEYFHIYPTIAQLITTVIVVIFSYFVQKYFTFRTVMNEEVTG